MKFYRLFTLMMYCGTFFGSLVTYGEVEGVVEGFHFQNVNSEHRYMNAMLANAMLYVKPENKMMDPLSGYPVEGWNHDPESGLYLRSFTQLTAIGEWIELMGNIAAGYADNPYISRDQALKNLELATNTLLVDQQDPDLSAKGLLGNFLGLEWNGRLGPLASDVSKKKFIEVFGDKKAEEIWKALEEKKWIKLIKDGEEAEIQRSSKYGSKYFDGALRDFDDEETIKEIMDILDSRVVKIIYGDNANLTASVAKTVGALMHSSLKSSSKASSLCLKLEKFIENQREGYEFLYDKKTHSFIFGWDATMDKFVGWENDKGEFEIAHMGYMVNEFRGPTIFVVLRYGIPMDAIRCMWFVIKSHKMVGGKEKFTLCSWDGSAFQALGLSMFMQELQNPVQKKILENLVDIEIDYSTRNNLPGFLSESYTGYKNQYTGSVGIPDLAATKEKRITTAPSIYTLGVAYMVAPEKMEKFLSDNWSTLSSLFSDHGPWEGYNVDAYKGNALMSILTLGIPVGKIIKFQTSAHLLSFILGAIGSAPENMKRYLDSHKLSAKLASFYRPGRSVNFLAGGNKVIPWTIDNSKCDIDISGGKVRLQGNDVGVGGVTLQPAKSSGFDLAGGILEIKYRSAYLMDNVKIIIKRKAVSGVPVPEIDITAILKIRKSPDSDQVLEIPLPAAPALRGIKEIVILYGEGQSRGPIDLTFKSLKFTSHKL